MEQDNSGRSLRDGLPELRSEPASGLGHPAGIPSALTASWPIPFPEDHEGLFCDAADEGAAVGLLALMTGISEETWCASWLCGIEYSLWRAACNPIGNEEVSVRQATLLNLLAEEAQGWWHFVEGVGPRFCPIDEWRQHIGYTKEDQTCRVCDGHGWVCENHLDLPWAGLSRSPRACNCGGAGCPCNVCNSELAASGRASLDASAIETRSAETERLGPKDESAVA